MNPLNLFRKSKAARSSHREVHMTWASTQIRTSVTRTRDFLRRRLWLWPIIAVVLLSIVGFTVRSAIEATMKNNLASALQTLLDLEVGMLKNWYAVQESNAESLANDSDFRDQVYALLAAGGEAQSQADLTAEQGTHRTQLHQELLPAMESHDYVGYFIADKTQRIIASSHSGLIGQSEIPEFSTFVRQAIEGETVVCAPFRSVVMIRDAAGRMRLGEPTMFVCAPIRDESFQVVATLALQIEPDREFTRILQLGRIGKSGETYAFNAESRMVSNSRFDEDLILLGLLPDEDDSRSILNLLIRDPQGDVTAGYRPKVRRAKLPLTRMADDAIAGNSNIDVEGYRDYRGVPVVGAWTWLEPEGIGVATEVDQAEAFKPLAILQMTFWILYALLILSSVAIFVFTLVVARLQRQAREAVAEAKQLGQYKLEEKLGEGAMGVVYKGYHAMLRRPTAVKMLHVDKVNEDSISRFEREVQITCNLTHPNTVAIYDYGRTPEDVFYYAMEYLEGIDLQQLVDTYGPQPESRVIHILMQICGSLYEAHMEGLVHRDIKPANVMLTKRGYQPDVVKVLDFGLVKAIDQRQQAYRTTTGSMAGTPLYMSPEAVQSPLGIDARSDIYAVGAVGYFLLTGQTVFAADGIARLLQMHVAEQPVAPSKRVETPVSKELEDALLACLKKSRADRPQTARELECMLRESPESGKWTIQRGDKWWSSNGPVAHRQASSRQTTAAASLDLDMTSGGLEEEYQLRPESEDDE